MKRLLATLAAGVVAATVCLTPAVAAEDDPKPAKYPQVQRPDNGGNTSDPGPAKYPRIEKPSTTGGNDDPKPVSWPAPTPG
ncbi:hypothetical protein E1263_03935 [Kribbella antibiotica]|uniref:Uncharacterized protein n=1 Tax=Kribbella antibiotica TaxID=190195 RepID=A0A4R4ZTZ0_9ACTN|nr:hypothetical protein [Kribbella antibiotica]TDD62315.1 hypothetical protein E1263_03935 [Kribbella antibiotica]